MTRFNSLNPKGVRDFKTYILPNGNNNYGQKNESGYTFYDFCHEEMNGKKFTFVAIIYK